MAVEGDVAMDADDPGGPGEEREHEGETEGGGPAGVEGTSVIPPEPNNAPHRLVFSKRNVGP